MDRVEAEERHGVGDNPLVNIAVAVKVWLRPEPVLFLRSTEVEWKQLKLHETRAVHVRSDHWFLDESCQVVSVRLPALFHVLKPRFADVRLRKSRVVDCTEMRVGYVAVK